VVLGASSVAQLDENLDALANLEFSSDELLRIDQFATEGHIDLWRKVAED
jgi:L-glyceraldehyde 3-phosphate reductase